MNANDLVDCFRDTLNWCQNGFLRYETERAKLSTTVYKEGFEHCNYNKALNNAKIELTPETTFEAAKKYVKKGKVGVLNFANPHYPGGGVANGAMAQEECLCRSSNLYPCLLSETAMKDYYEYNKQNTDLFFSDRVVYTENITVFKNDEIVPKILQSNEWFNVSVLTCAAPYIVNRKHTNSKALEDLFKRRITNVFEVAIENNITVLVLGAFGCGAFGNPPELVSRAFKRVIEEKNYDAYFTDIVFSIKDFTTKNFKEFAKTFNIEPLLILNAPEYKLPNIDLPNGKVLIGPTVCSCREYSITNENDIVDRIGQGETFGGRLYENDEIQYRHYEELVRWKYRNKYYNKQFSIFGDSISTLDGYNPKGYNVFYLGNNCLRNEVNEMKDTWWGKVIDFLGGELLVNNSWSGSRVTRIPENDYIFPSGCSNERTAGLHINRVTPNVIIVYIGTNDWGNAVRINGDINGFNSEYEFDFFETAYDSMISKIKENYPFAEIWCCTLSKTVIKGNPNFVFPLNRAGKSLDDYNHIIRKIANIKGCTTVDLYSFNQPYETLDGTHPSVRGMNTIATTVLKSVCGNEVDKFLL